MDPRHESFQEELLNQLITIINCYLKNNIDTIVVNQRLQDQIKNICNKIYPYLGLKVDVDGILSKHNLLSIDVVFFPKVTDPEANKIFREDAFLTLIDEIYSIINEKHTLLSHDLMLSREIINLLQTHELPKLEK
ncbi:MAG: hypothetical protein KIT56_08605 [Gammaproteobacteria bacterium]|nr:hypothetical protein [Gammaproteobacteria bacterium]MCW5583918.1 hypothetical protein [Gammaproteobacteria bacterium]